MARTKDPRARVIVRIDQEWSFPLKMIGNGNIKKAIAMLIEEALAAKRDEMEIEETVTRRLVPINRKTEAERRAASGKATPHGDSI